ncbi:MAG: hypothetical protein RJB02_963 [Pseudomonadota bacterium]|jgi:hypothetical protein
MRALLLTALFALAATPLAAQRVEVADADNDWADFPALAKSMTVNLGDGAMADVDRLVAAGKCKAIGNKKRIRMQIPFLVQFGDTGSVDRVMLKRIGCPEVESIAASAALYAAQDGRIRQGSGNAAGWYRGSVNYILD